MDIMHYCQEGLALAEWGIANEKLGCNIAKEAHWKGERAAYLAVISALLKNKESAKLEAKLEETARPTKQSEEIKPCKRSGDCAHERVTEKCLGVDCGVYLPA